MLAIILDCGNPTSDISLCAKAMEQLQKWQNDQFGKIVWDEEK